MELSHALRDILDKLDTESDHLHGIGPGYVGHPREACGEESPEDEYGLTYNCTRLKTHVAEGSPHIACGYSTHGIATWQRFDQ